MTDELTEITGVGPAIAESLEDAGYETIDDVDGADVEDLAQVDLLGEASAQKILDRESRGGRPSKFEKAKEHILDAARNGTTKEGCARAGGVTYETLRTWLEEKDEFSAKFRRERAKAEQDLVEDARDDDPKWVLERSYGYVKTERREIEGEHEHDHSGEVDLSLSSDEKDLLDATLDDEPDT